MPEKNSSKQSKSSHKGSQSSTKSLVDESNEQLEQKALGREQELRDLDVAELEERYINTFAQEPQYSEDLDEDAKRDFLVSAIHGGAPKPPAPTMQAAGAPVETDEDSEGRLVELKDGRKQLITGDLEDMVVVRQVNLTEINGGVVEIPNTEQIQSYRPEVFNKMLKDKFFSDSKIRVELINDPRKRLEGEAKKKKSAKKKAEA